MLQWDGWSDDARQFLDGVQGWYVDISSTAKRAVSAIHMLWDYAMASRGEELLKVSMDYIEMKGDFDIQGKPLVLRVTSESTRQGVWADSINSNTLADARGDIDEIDRRLKEDKGMCSGADNSASKSLGSTWIASTPF